MSNIAIKGGATGTAVFTIESPTTSTDRTLTLPDVTATVITDSAGVLDIGSGQVYKDASGNVGIGTSSPAHKLDISGTAYGGVYIKSTSTNFSGMLIENTNSATKWQIGVEGGTYNTAGKLNIGIDAVGSAIIIDSSRNVGIGTSSVSSSTKLEVYGNNAAAHVGVRVNNAAADGYATLWMSSAGDNTGIIRGGASAAAFTNQLAILTGSAIPITFSTNNVERVRIDSSGRTLIGITATRPNGGVLQVSAQGQTGLVTYTTSTTSNNAAYFENGNGIVGTIVTNGTSTSYNTSSDYRLKEDWVAVADASTRVNALKPINFAWKVDGTRVDGFLAHELAEVVPEAVTGTKDAMRDEEYEITPAVKATYDEEGNELTPAIEAVMGTRTVPEYQGIDQSKLVPLLTAALQEALARIETLEADVATLKGAA